MVSSINSQANEVQVLLHLSLIPNIGPACALKIINKLHPENESKSYSLEEIYHYNKNDFIQNFGVSYKTASLLTNGLSDRIILDKEMALIEKYNITLYTLLDKTYPELLKQIYHPPMVLYCKGAPLSRCSKQIAIVGSRKADTYAEQSINKLVPELVAQNWNIVSGGALGVDSMAHQSTLQAHGKTIAVFGSGLMNPYPAINKELFRSIVRNGGTLVSPFSLQTPPSKGHFPARNRIIAGLSEGCVVVQAAEKSGALITAQFALDQGRHVFALPGAIDNKLSAGCHKIIQQGAKLITNTNDIFEELGETLTQQTLQNKKHLETVSEKETSQKIIRKNNNERSLLEYLESPTSLDDMCSKTKLTIAELQNQLFSLQLDGAVKQNFAGLWEKIL